MIPAPIPLLSAHNFNEVLMDAGRHKDTSTISSANLTLSSIIIALKEADFFKLHPKSDMKAYHPPSWISCKNYNQNKASYTNVMVFLFVIITDTEYKGLVDADTSKCAGLAGAIEHKSLNMRLRYTNHLAGKSLSKKRKCEMKVLCVGNWL